MKKLITAFVVCSLTLGVNLAQARSWDDIKNSGTINMVTEGEYPPFNMFDGEQLTGYEVEVGEAIAKELGLKIKWKAVTFDAQIVAIKQARYDLAIASHGFSEERAKAVDFADPHYCSGGVIVTTTNGPKTAKDIAGKIASAQIGTSYFASLEKLGTLEKINTYRTDPEAFLALKNKRVNLWVSDRFSAKEILAKDGGNKYVTGDMLFQEKVSAIFPKNTSKVVEKWNGALSALIKDGTIAKISDKYFKEDVTCK